MGKESHQFAFRIEKDPLREHRYRWTIFEGFQIHLRSPQSYETHREAEESAKSALAKFVRHWQDRE
jgi:hypothetical protein